MADSRWVRSHAARWLFHVLSEGSADSIAATEWLESTFQKPMSTEDGWHLWDAARDLIEEHL